MFNIPNIMVKRKFSVTGATVKSYIKTFFWYSNIIKQNKYCLWPSFLRLTVKITNSLDNYKLNLSQIHYNFFCFSLLFLQVQRMFAFLSEFCFMSMSITNFSSVYKSLMKNHLAIDHQILNLSCCMNIRPTLAMCSNHLPSETKTSSMGGVSKNVIGLPSSWRPMAMRTMMRE